MAMRVKLSFLYYSYNAEYNNNPFKNYKVIRKGADYILIQNTTLNENIKSIYV